MNKHISIANLRPNIECKLLKQQKSMAFCGLRGYTFTQIKCYRFLLTQCSKK